MRTGNFNRIIRTTLVAAFCCQMSAGAAQIEKGKDTVEHLVSLFSAWSGKEADQHVYAEAAQNIDYELMAHRALGATEWEKLSPVQRKEFTKTFKSLVEQRYYPRWHKIFYKGRLAFISETSANGDTFVKTNLTLGKKTDLLVWHLANKSGDHKVISLAVADKDLLTLIGSRLKKKMDKSGFDGVMAWMKDKLEDDEDANSSTADSTSSL